MKLKNHDSYQHTFILILFVYEILKMYLIIMTVFNRYLF